MKWNGFVATMYFVIIFINIIHITDNIPIGGYWIYIRGSWFLTIVFSILFGAKMNTIWGELNERKNTTRKE